MQVAKFEARILAGTVFTRATVDHNWLSPELFLEKHRVFSGGTISLRIWLQILIEYLVQNETLPLPEDEDEDEGYELQEAISNEIWDHAESLLKYDEDTCFSNKHLRQFKEQQANPFFEKMSEKLKYIANREGSLELDILSDIEQATQEFNEDIRRPSKHRVVIPKVIPLLSRFGVVCLSFDSLTFLRDPLPRFFNPYSSSEAQTRLFFSIGSNWVRGLATKASPIYEERSELKKLELLMSHFPNIFMKRKILSKLGIRSISNVETVSIPEEFKVEVTLYA